VSDLDTGCAICAGDTRDCGCVEWECAENLEYTCECLCHASILIGITGVMRSGKDTVAAHLIAGHGFERVSFADKIRDFMYALNPLLPNITAGQPTVRLRAVVDAYGWEAVKDDFPEARALLQRGGTDAGRVVLGDDVWINATLGSLPQLAVISDVRYPNEADAIRDRGGFIWRVTRPGHEAPEGAHATETAMAAIVADETIANDGSLEDLYAAVDRLYAATQTRTVVQGVSQPWPHAP